MSYLPEDAMAKRRKTAKEPDRHKPAIVVRIPEAWRPVLDALQRKSLRPVTTEVLLALAKHAASEGIETPEIIPSGAK